MYEIVSNSDEGIVANKVSTLLSEGWVLLGELKVNYIAFYQEARRNSITGTIFTQTLIKEIENDN